MAVIRMKGISVKMVSALVNLLRKYHRVKVYIDKPRFSRTVELKIEGSDARKFISDLAMFCSEVGVETDIS